MSAMGVVAFVLLGCALVLVAGVEWPRISAKVGSDARAGRRRARRKEALTLIDGDAVEPADSDDFAKSVERDLASLPVFEERDDDRSQRK
jgi:hypothetical protein